VNPVLPLDHGTSESYPLMNLESGKCLDYDSMSVLIQTDCNLSTAKRWELLNDGKQICDIHSTQCISVPVKDGNKFVHNVILLLPMMLLDHESGKKKCEDCWLSGAYTQHVSVGKNQIRFIYGTPMKASSSYLPDRLSCMAVSQQPESLLFNVTVVKNCNVNNKNHTWSFVSFE